MSLHPVAAQHLLPGIQAEVMSPDGQPVPLGDPREVLRERGLELARVGQDEDADAAAEVRATAAHVLGTVLRLLHPAMPFVTEHLWDHFGYGPACSLIRAPWPQAVPVADPADARAEALAPEQLLCVFEALA